MSDAQSRITTLLSNETLARLERLRLLALRRFTNPSRGEHLSRRGGSSTDFRDYRDYVPGDDTRFVDWNIFARLHRPYVKLFHEEEELHVVLLVDASNSMRFEGKLERAKQLAAALGVLGLMAGERISAWAFRAKGEALASVPPRRGRGSMRTLFRFLESIEAGGDAPLEEAIEGMLRHHAGRGLLVLLSDFLTTGDLRHPCNLAFGRGLEVSGVQILGPAELDPELATDARLVDSEDTHTLDVSLSDDVVTLYHEYRLAHERRLADLCRQRNGRFLCCDASMPLDNLLFGELRRQGWVA